MHTYRVTVELLTKDKSRHEKATVITKADFDLESVWEIVRLVEARKAWSEVEEVVCECRLEEAEFSS